MNQIYFNSDPLLNGYQNQNNSYRNDPYFMQQLIQNSHQENLSQKDWIAELDNATSELDESIISRLNKNSEYINLSNELKEMIQAEIMSFVKQKLNCYPSVADNVKKQLNIIKETVSKSKDEEKRNMNELNDYMKNYSHMSFNEYKKLKSGNSSTNNSTNNIKNKIQEK